MVQLAAEYEAGADIKDLARGWQMHRGTISAQLRKAGAALRGQGLTDEQIGEVVRLYAAGMACRPLAERIGCDFETIRRALKAAGVERRKAWERT
jgi:lambda repressor-like predicted transcriptional regulator